MWISRREYERLVGDIELWRDKAEREQKRADAAIDQALTEAWRQPLSLNEPTVDAKAMREQAEAMLLKMRDLETDDDGSDLGEELSFSPDVVEALKAVK